MTKPLKGEDRARALAGLDSWSEAENRDAVTKSFVFANFNAAFAFMTQVAELAERMDHHPEWFNVYNRVEVTLTTHDAGGVTHKDIRLAAAMNEVAARSTPAAPSA